MFRKYKSPEKRYAAAALPSSGRERRKKKAALSQTNRPPRSSKAILEKNASNVQVVSGSHAAVPVAGILDGAFLVAEVDVHQTESLAVSFGPFVVIKQAPCMVAANVRAVLDCTGELRQMSLVELYPPRIRRLRGIFRQRAVGVGAAVLGDFDDGAVVLLRNARRRCRKGPTATLPNRCK